MSDFDCLLGSCGRIVVDVGWFGALGHGDFGGGGRIPPTSAMNMGATERYRSRFQRCPMALCDREGLSGSTHGSRLVCLRGIRAIVNCTFGVRARGQAILIEDGLSLGVKQGSHPCSVLAIDHPKSEPGSFLA